MSYTFFLFFYGIFYAVVRQISMLFTDSKDSVFCYYGVAPCLKWRASKSSYSNETPAAVRPRNNAGHIMGQHWAILFFFMMMW